VAEQDIDELREHWLDHVRDVIRSRHYTWLPEGLGGEPVDVAMTCLLTDIMHVCRRAGISFEDVSEAARRRFEEEESSLGHAEK
jgi:hypothetical protein